MSETSVVTEEGVFSLVPGVPSSWFVPVFSLFNLSDIVSMEPIVDPDLEGNITFDEAGTKFNYDGGNLPSKFFGTAEIKVIDIDLKVTTKFKGQGIKFSKQLVALAEHIEALKDEESFKERPIKTFLESLLPGKADRVDNELDTEIEERI